MVTKYGVAELSSYNSFLVFKSKRFKRAIRTTLSTVKGNYVQVLQEYHIFTTPFIVAGVCKPGHAYLSSLLEYLELPRLTSLCSVSHATECMQKPDLLTSTLYNLQATG